MKYYLLGVFFVSMAVFYFTLFAALGPGMEPVRDGHGSVSPVKISGRGLGEWERLLKSPASADRLAAAQALAGAGPKAAAAVDSLINTLTDPDAFVRSSAAVALGEIGPGAARAIPALIDVFKQSGFLHRGIVGQAIAKFGPEAVTALTGLLKDPDPGIRREALHDLILIGPSAGTAVPQITRLLGDADGAVREEAAFALWKIAARREAIGVIARNLNDPNDFVRLTAVEHIGNIGPEAIDFLPAVVRCLEDRSQPVRNKAAEALGRFGPGAKPAVVPLIRSVEGGGQSVSLGSASEAIGRIGPVAVPDLMAALSERDDTIRRTAADALARMGGGPAKPAVPLLADIAANDPIPVNRVFAARALWKIAQDERAITTLIRVLEANPSGAGYIAIMALTDIGPKAKDAVPVLLANLRRRDSLSPRAAEALGRIGPGAKDAVAALTSALDDGDPRLRSPAALALWRVAGSEAGVSSLAKRIHSPDDLERFEAIDALGQVGPAAAAAIPALAEALKNDPSHRGVIARTLARIGPQARSTVPALIEAYRAEPLPEKLQIGAAVIALDPLAAHNEGIRGMEPGP